MYCNSTASYGNTTCFAYTGALRVAANQATCKDIAAQTAVTVPILAVSSPASLPLYRDVGPW